ncbi:invasion associated locus B family protein [Ahrensia sp. R2A130]|uniref:invasion associated locus B family protein n=1 Tax=Ahrensia sp. R2A130 TaxID=744979 RepID=UPI0001E0A4F5|nr:invasion associated locus B family protein [Ahrensia sp. R2A130]EFL87733.1 conserved hypothetical protein [Ahrensia sp. R2A130]
MLKYLARFSLVAVALTTTPASAGEWFTHPFGELRAYHGSWLAVCSDSGRGECRAVQMAGDDGSGSFFGSRRMSIVVKEPQGYTVEIFQRGMTTPISGSVTLNIDGSRTNLTDDQWSDGAPEYTNVLETFSLRGDGLMNKLVAEMKAGNQLYVRHSPSENDRRTIRFDLHGFTSVMNAINKHLQNRKN